MQLEPKDLFEKLEFDKIIALLENECLGELGKAKVHEIRPQTDREWIESRLREVKEYKQTIDAGDKFPIATYFDISEELNMLAIEGYVLPEEGLRNLNIILVFIKDIFKFFNAARQQVYPRLYDIIRPINFNEALIEEIEKVIDEEGNIKPDASPALQKIRRLVGNKTKELDKVFRQVVAYYKTKGWLADNIESFRNGRRVLSVPSEHKRKIRGIIHDESSTGKTAFIEPEASIDINNDIFDLQQEEKKEIYRILRELSATLRPYVEDMHKYMDLLVRFDVIQTKGRLAYKINGIMPRITSKPSFGYTKAYHPLLYLKNLHLGKETIPFDLTLLHNNRIVVLSGPNAGGKSITMKSVGLLQLMFQSGMLIPVEEESKVGIFHKMFADIGDQQSLEDDLSTYSSRLANMKLFLEHADKQSLVLIDEFGSGTDPKIGGAIAESILRELNNRKVHGVITTHYSNLKIFAFKTRHIVNGSMTFDKDTLSPTYEFRVGRPGSSYAYEIAQKSGLGKEILDYAKHRTGKNEKAVDQLLVDLQREKQELEDQLKRLKEKEDKLDRLVRNYDNMSKELDYRRKKVKLEAKENALQQTAKDNREFERIIREIREERNLERAKELAAKVKEEREQLVEEVGTLREEIYYQPATTTAKKKGNIKAGDFVKLRTGGATGQVESITKNKAVVVMGEMRMTINTRDLQHANEPLDVQANRSVKMDTNGSSTGFQSKIDIRGMRMEEALQVVQDFVDQALVNDTPYLRILHGKGNGVLRKAVKAKLKEYKQINMRIWHPEEEQGGNGVTLIELQ